jgi:hypothetical protein
MCKFPSTNQSMEQLDPTGGCQYTEGNGGEVGS